MYHLLRNLFTFAFLKLKYINNRYCNTVLSICMMLCSVYLMLEDILEIAYWYKKVPLKFQAKF